MSMEFMERFYKGSRSLDQAAAVVSIMFASMEDDEIIVDCESIRWALTLLEDLLKETSMVMGEAERQPMRLRKEQKSQLTE